MTLNSTNNLIMFQCERDILLNDPKHKIEVFTYLTDWYNSKGLEIKNNFSHDNLTLVTCWLKKFEPEFVKYVPLFGRHTRRPDVLAQFLYMKAPILFIWLLPVIYISRIISMLRVRRINSRGQIEISTSGKIISYFLYSVFDLNVLGWILTRLVERDKDLRNWRNVFSIYFPINHFVRKAFENRGES